MATTATAASALDKDTQIPSFQPSDFSFLEQLLNILEKISTGDDQHEIAALASKLKDSFQKCQSILDYLPGADMSPQEQAKVLAEEMEVLRRKTAQLDAYMAWSVFDAPAATSSPSTTTTQQQQPPRQQSPAPKPRLTTTLTEGAADMSLRDQSQQ